MSRIKWVAILAVLAIGTYILMSSIYTVSEVEQAIITQFGRPVGAPVTDAGLKFKAPRRHPLTIRGREERMTFMRTTFFLTAEKSLAP